MAQKSYNFDALRGGKTDDMELVQEYGLPPEVAYTPQINDAITNMNVTQAYDYYISKGDDDKTARSKAEEIRKNDMKTLQQLMK